MTFRQMRVQLFRFNKTLHPESHKPVCLLGEIQELSSKSAADDRQSSVHRLRTCNDFAQQLRGYIYTFCVACCLVFCNAHMPVHAEAVRKTDTVKAAAPAKESPEVLFMKGERCLKQRNTACARVALAKIPSSSAYAKLLQGGIAIAEHLTDRALQLLLPLQTDKQLVPEAKMALHLYLAAVFEHIDDIQQAIDHLMHAETTLKPEPASSGQDNIRTMHERIWEMLNRLQHAELIQLRGNTTDNVMQGWIDLGIAMRSHDIIQASSQWRTLYPDHPALEFADHLAAKKTAVAQLKTNLSSNGSIALILPLAADTSNPVAEAFKAGLQTAISHHALPNQINTYPATEHQQNIDDVYTLAKNEGNAYFIIPSFSSNPAEVRQVRLTEAGNVIQVGSLADEEARHIAAYAASRHLQKITAITLENDTFKQLVTNFEVTWQSHPGYASDTDALERIMLPESISANDSSLLNLKAHIEDNAPDMILLALPAALTRAIRPHLPISIPTLSFSHANEPPSDAVTYSTLNAVRFFDIPFIVNQAEAFNEDYKKAAANLSTNALVRWFALGADSLQLLIAAEALSDQEVSISGLTGTLTMNSMGTIQRQLPLARFTHRGATLEQ